MLITITGKPVSGKSTIAKIIAAKHDFKRIGVGDFFKEEANKRGMSSEEFNAFCMNDPAFDFLIDKQSAEMGKKLEGQNFIFDSRMGWYFVPKSFKVFVDLNEEEMAKRLVLSDREGKEKYKTIEQATRSLSNRLKLENERYQKLYGINNEDLTKFDLVVDSLNKTPEQLADIVWERYVLFKNSKKA